MQPGRLLGRDTANTRQKLEQTFISSFYFFPMVVDFQKAMSYTECDTEQVGLNVCVCWSCICFEMGNWKKRNTGEPKQSQASSDNHLRYFLLQINEVDI